MGSVKVICQKLRETLLLVNRPMLSRFWRESGEETFEAFIDWQSKRPLSERDYLRPFNDDTNY